MKELIVVICLLSFCCVRAESQELKAENENLAKAFSLAVGTLHKNTSGGIIKAGGTYGGEWARDASINTWNAASLLMPEDSKSSLWNVTTEGRTLIGHQYWDKIIWVIGAYHYYSVNGDTAFLRQAYIASRNTMAELEKSVFDSHYGLFKGPSVFNDGIAGYEEPVYDPAIHSSGVVDFPGSKGIKCLSTNCVYYEAYRILSATARLYGDKRASKEYGLKAAALKGNIRKYLYDSKAGKLNYLIDQNGKVHTFNEGLGISFAVLFGVVDRKEAERMIAKVYLYPYGLPSIYPPFKRFSDEKPGRHNNIVWPFVDAFWAEACLKSGREDLFERELNNLSRLAVEKGNGCFYEIYNGTTGEPDGGWQEGHHWDSVYDQTWSATGYIRLVLNGIFGLKFTAAGLSVSPDIEAVNRFGIWSLEDLNDRSAKITIRIKGKGNSVGDITIDGTKAKRVCLKPELKGNHTIEFTLK